MVAVNRDVCILVKCFRVHTEVAFFRVDRDLLQFRAICKTTQCKKAETFPDSHLCKLCASPEGISSYIVDTIRYRDVFDSRVIFERILLDDGDRFTAEGFIRVIIRYNGRDSNIFIITVIAYELNIFTDGGALECKIR